MSMHAPQAANTAVDAGTPLSSWAAYTACAWGLAFAAISFYWGSGGRIGLDTVGGAIERRALAGDPLIYAAVWTTGALKVVGAVLALALARPWGRRLPRRLVTWTAWAAAVALIAYGGLFVAADALAAGGVVTPRQPIAWKPLWWHLWLWDMSFLLWGILFAVATRQFRRHDPAAL